MYICICNAIRESDLRHAARGTRCDVEALYARFGKRPQCSQCLEEAEDIVQEERLAAAELHLQAA
jgi:bacterioferritin-associated ferredoxin